MDWADLILALGALFFIYLLVELDRRVKSLEADNYQLKNQVRWLQGECVVFDKRIKPFEARESERDLNDALAQFTRETPEVRQPSNGS